MLIRRITVKIFEYFVSGSKYDVSAQLLQRQFVRQGIDLNIYNEENRMEMKRMLMWEWASTSWLRWRIEILDFLAPKIVRAGGARAGRARAQCVSLRRVNSPLGECRQPGYPRTSPTTRPSTTDLWVKVQCSGVSKLFRWVFRLHLIEVKLRKCDMVKLRVVRPSRCLSEWLGFQRVRVLAENSVRA